MPWIAAAVILAVAIVLVCASGRARAGQPCFGVRANCQTPVIVNHHAATVIAPATVVTNFAVPVGLPVAQVANYYYSTADIAGAQPAFGPLRTTDQGPGGSKPAFSATARQVAAKRAELFTASCVKCHHGDKAAASLDLSDLSQVALEDRLLAIKLVRKGKMPKGAKLSAEQFRSILDHLEDTDDPAADSPLATWSPDGGKTVLERPENWKELARKWAAEADKADDPNQWRGGPGAEAKPSKSPPAQEAPAPLGAKAEASEPRKRAEDQKDNQPAP